MMNVNKITYRFDKFQNISLLKSCLKTNWESFHYNIKLGKFESTLNLLKFNI
jgi:hypothetical protein